jgi:hypothetical protein
LVSKIKREISFKRTFVGNGIKHTINGIEREKGDPDDYDDPFLINAFLHKLNLTTSWQSCKGAYRKLQTIFGNFHKDESFRADVRMPNYRRRLIKKLPNFDIYFFTNSINYAAPNLIEIHPKENTSSKQYRELLHSLNAALGVLNISVVEYAIDLYCHDRKSLQRLFRTFKRYIHVSYSRGASHYSQQIDLSKNISLNSIIRMGDVKIYERGPDGKRDKSGWNIETCDRVRLEFSASRTIFLKLKIKTVTDFLENAQFQKINGNIYKFKYFDGSRKLPQCWEAYTSSDDQGNKNCLQYEINHYRPIVPNINQYLKDIVVFDHLKDALLNAMSRFDEEWHN